MGDTITTEPERGDAERLGLGRVLELGVRAGGGRGGWEGGGGRRRRRSGATPRRRRAAPPPSRRVPHVDAHLSAGDPQVRGAGDVEHAVDPAPRSATGRRLPRDYEPLGGRLVAARHQGARDSETPSSVERPPILNGSRVSRHGSGRGHRATHYMPSEVADDAAVAVRALGAAARHREADLRTSTRSTTTSQLRARRSRRSATSSPLRAADRARQSIHLSGGISGTVRSAEQARDQRERGAPERIEIVGPACAG